MCYRYLMFHLKCSMQTARAWIPARLCQSVRSHAGKPSRCSSTPTRCLSGWFANYCHVLGLDTQRLFCCIAYAHQLQRRRAFSYKVYHTHAWHSISLLGTKVPIPAPSSNLRASHREPPDAWSPSCALLRSIIRSSSGHLLPVTSHTYDIRIVNGIRARPHEARKRRRDGMLLTRR